MNASTESESKDVSWEGGMHGAVTEKRLKGELEKISLGTAR